MCENVYEVYEKIKIRRVSEKRKAKKRASQSFSLFSLSSIFLSRRFFSLANVFSTFTQDFEMNKIKVGFERVALLISMTSNDFFFIFLSLQIEFSFHFPHPQKFETAIKKSSLTICPRIKKQQKKMFELTQIKIK